MQRRLQRLTKHISVVNVQSFHVVFSPFVINIVIIVANSYFPIFLTVTCTCPGHCPVYCCCCCRGRVVIIIIVVAFFVDVAGSRLMRSSPSFLAAAVPTIVVIRPQGFQSFSVQRNRTATLLGRLDFRYLKCRTHRLRGRRTPGVGHLLDR